MSRETLIAKIDEVLELLKTKKFSTAEEKAKFLSILSVLGGTLQGADANFITINKMNVINSNLTTILSLVKQSEDLNIITFNTYLDVIVEILPFLNSNIISSNLKPVEDYAKVVKNELESINFKDARTMYSDISTYHERLNGDNSDGIKTIIETAKKDIVAIHTSITSNNTTIQSLLTSSTNSDKAINALLVKSESNKKAIESKLASILADYVKVFGDTEGAEQVDGIQQQYEKIKKLYEENYAEQKKIYEKFNKDIESQLGKATMAGLAASYIKESNKFDKPITFWNRVFMFSLVTVIGFSFYRLLSIELVDNLSKLGTYLIQSLPILGPLTWLAIYASSRRSEAERLRQEYNHKATVANTFLNFKDEFEKSKSKDDNRVMEEFINSTITSIHFNPSQTLSKKQKSDMPLERIVDNIKKVSRSN